LDDVKFVVVFWGSFNDQKKTLMQEKVSEKIRWCLGCIKFGYMFVVEISDLLRHNIRYAWAK
jgi:hypothetical protein